MPRWTPEEYAAYQAGRKPSSPKPEQVIDVDNLGLSKENHWMKVAASMIWEEYLETGSIHRACKRFLISGETARKYLTMEGYRLNSSAWTESEIEQLKAAYADKNGFDLKPLAKQLSRTHAAVACKADELGICGERGRQVRTALARSNLSAAQEARFLRNGGAMLGKKHTDLVKATISAANFGRKRSGESVEKQMRTRLNRYGTLAPTNGSGRSWKSGWREISGKRIYARSRWEANYARYLQWLKEHQQILEWEHEPDTFWFDKIKRGCRTYLPDFKVTNNDKSFEYHETKGWMDARSKTKIKRMAKYHPSIILKILDGKWFKSNQVMLRGLIKDWEHD